MSPCGENLLQPSTPKTDGECANNGGSRTTLWGNKQTMCFVVIFVLILFTNKIDSAETGYTSKLTDGHSNVPDAASENNALVIDYDACGKDTCFECKTTVTVKHIPYESMLCDSSNGNIKNGTCYLCNNTCLTADDIRLLWEEKRKISCVNNAPVDIDCCLIAQMENLKKQNVEGRYNCYTKRVHEKYGKSAIRPLFQCKAERCDELNTETFICKCSNLNYKFLGQENLSKCSKEERTSSMTECNMPVAGEWHNCRCHKNDFTDTEIGNMVSCDSLRTEAGTGIRNASRDTNALLIDYDACGKDTCFECKTPVTVKHIPYEPMLCDRSNGNIKNGNCYLCNNTCLTTGDISLLWEEKRKINCVNNAPVDIDCCLIAQMENLKKRNVEGRCNCYRKWVHEKYGKSAIRPLFQCRFGRKGERCDELNTETFICKCSKFNYKFLDQDKLSECNKEPETSYMSECYMTVTGEGHNCRCRRHKNVTKSEIVEIFTDTEIGKMVSCNSPRTEEVMGCCAASFSSLSAGLFLNLLISYLTYIGSILEDLWY